MNKSKKGGSWFIWLFVFAWIALSLFDRAQDDREVSNIIREADLAAEQAISQVSQNSEQSGYVKASSLDWSFSTPQLQKAITKMPYDRQHHFYTWSSSDQFEITGSASGVDKKAYFANSYLVGFKPFSTSSVWEPLATLALRKSYVLDHELYGPLMAEIWQNSRQAYLYTRGDCEDHAIILADWLIAEGHTARVVLGTYRDGGHAWVVLFKDGKEYILEATDKRRPRSINDFQLARLATDYRPVYQFDRDHFWVNTGSSMTTRYNDKKWQRRSTFLRRS